MFEGVISAFTKFFSKDRVLALILFLVLAWVLYNYSESKTFVLDQMETGNSAPAADPVATPTPSPAPASANALQPVANPADMLPKDHNAEFAALNPQAMNGGSILMPDLLTAGYHIGLDTIGQTLRNANLQLRSDPIISRSDVGPWNQSTIEPDLGRAPLEIGECKR